MSLTTYTFPLNDGSHIPGFAWGNGSGNAKKTAIESGICALQSGIRHIDTAEGYNNEAETGEAIKGARLGKEEVYVTSKISGPKFNPIPVSKVRSAVEQTTKALGFIPDLYLIHNPFVIEPYEDLPKAWKELEDLKDEGKLRSIGVSNFRPQDLELILENARYKPAVNQIEYHPYLLTHLAPVLAIHQKHNIRTSAYGPLTPLLSSRHPTGGPIKPILARIAQRINTESAALPKGHERKLPIELDEIAVLLLWVRAKEVVVVSASGNKDNIGRLGKVAHLPGGLLTQEEVEEVERVGKGVHFRKYVSLFHLDWRLSGFTEMFC
jgi:diketogulonate reductase-like aldo/keto reductase